jgi:hypothetical protein
MNIHEEIAKKAYELWEQSRGIPGSELDNWLEAERIVKATCKEEKSPEQKDLDANEAERSGGRKNKAGDLTKKRG